MKQKKKRRKKKKGKKVKFQTEMNEIASSFQPNWWNDLCMKFHSFEAYYQKKYMKQLTCHRRFFFPFARRTFLIDHNFLFFIFSTLRRFFFVYTCHFPLKIFQIRFKILFTEAFTNWKAEILRYLIRFSPLATNKKHPILIHTLTPWLLTWQTEFCGSSFYCYKWIKWNQKKHLLISLERERERVTGEVM